MAERITKTPIEVGDKISILHCGDRDKDMDKCINCYLREHTVTEIKKTERFNKEGQKEYHFIIHDANRNYQIDDCYALEGECEISSIRNDGKLNISVRR